MSKNKPRSVKRKAIKYVDCSKKLSDSLEDGEFAFGNDEKMYKVKLDGSIEEIKAKKAKISNK